MVVGHRLRVVMLGTPAFAVPTLDALLASRHSVTAVVTQPDRRRGRGQQTTDAPVKSRAREAGLPVLQPVALADPSFHTALASTGAEIGVVAAYGRILPESILAVPPRGMINVHASLLPRYRGAAPVHRAVMAGEAETGVTIMRVVRALDAGPMLSRVRRPIDADETSAEVERDLARLGADLLVDTLNRMADDGVVETPQEESLATYAPRLTKEEGLVDWSRSCREIHDQIRGLHPWPHAFTFAHGRRIILLRSSPLGGGAAAPPGIVLAAHGDDLRVATGRGVLQIVELQAEGRRPMRARDFLAGHRLSPGDALTGLP
jgi:methionyl-tRNA formyltransferase